MDQYVVLVKPGNALPAVGKDIPLESALTGRKYAVKVKRIRSLKWNSEGNLVVEVDGDRKELDEGEAEGWNLGSKH